MSYNRLLHWWNTDWPISCSKNANDLVCSLCSCKLVQYCIQHRTFAALQFCIASFEIEIPEPNSFSAVKESVFCVLDNPQHISFRHLLPAHTYFTTRLTQQVSLFQTENHTASNEEGWYAILPLALCSDVFHLFCFI